MADILIQFHAIREELLPFVEACVDDFNLYVTAFRYFPFHAVEVPREDLGGRFLESTWREFALTISPPVLSVASSLKFADCNPDELRLSIGKRTEEGLRQSSLAARTSNPEALKLWRRIARRLKDITTTGVTVINPKTGASVKDRTFRYTPGVKALELQGVPILPVAGGNIFKLEENV